MIFTPSELDGAFVIDLEPKVDERGLFARAWCEEELGAQGLDARVAQCNLSCNHRRGTVRGLHYQAPPHAEVKLVRCTRGAVYDVIADLRPESRTYLHWIGVELSADNRRAIYVPEGFAHGYQTLTDVAETYYQVSVPYAPSAERGVRWDDPALAIDWPLPDPILSEKDAAWPDYVAATRT